MSALWHLTYVNTCNFALIDNTFLFIEFAGDFIELKVYNLPSLNTDGIHQARVRARLEYLAGARVPLGLLAVALLPGDMYDGPLRDLYV